MRISIGYWNPVKMDSWVMARGGIRVSEQAPGVPGYKNPFRNDGPSSHRIMASILPPGKKSIVKGVIVKRERELIID
jgi:hypothetical protein